MRLLLRLWNVIYGTATTLVLFFEKRNPEALLERERERFRSVVGEFNKGLVVHATLIERLKSSLVRSAKQSEQTELKVIALTSAGDRPSAGRHALELQALQSTIAADQERLTAAEHKYRALVDARDVAVTETRKRIEHLRQQIGDLKVNRAVADLENMAASMVGSINDPGDDLNRLSEMLGDENEKAKARVRVAAGRFEAEITPAGVAERDALAAKALEDYLAQQRKETTLALPDLSDTPEIVIPPKTH